MVLKAVSKGTKLVGQRRYLTGVTSGIEMDGDGDRMMPECIRSFERQANEKPILLFPGPHEGPYLDDLGIMTLHRIEDNGDWYTEYRLYDEMDGVDQKTLDAANKLWKKATGAPPYTMPCPIGFSIEGREANVQERHNGKDFYDIVLHGVVAVPEPAYQDAEATPVMKSKEKTVVNKYRKMFDVKSSRPVDQARFDEGSKRMILDMLDNVGEVVAKSKSPVEMTTEVDLIIDAFKEGQLALIEDCRPNKEGVFKSMSLIFSKKPKARKEKIGTVAKSKSGAIYEKTENGWELKLTKPVTPIGTLVTKGEHTYQRVEKGWKRVHKAPAVKPGERRNRGKNIMEKLDNGKWKYVGRVGGEKDGMRGATTGARPSAGKPKPTSKPTQVHNQGGSKDKRTESNVKVSSGKPKSFTSPAQKKPTDPMRKTTAAERTPTPQTRQLASNVRGALEKSGVRIKGLKYHPASPDSVSIIVGMDAPDDVVNGVFSAMQKAGIPGDKYDVSGDSSGEWMRR